MTMPNVGKKDVPVAKSVKADKVKGAAADSPKKGKPFPPLSKIKGGK